MCHYCLGNSISSYLWRIGFVIVFAIVVTMYNYVIITSTLRLKSVTLSINDQSTNIDTNISDLPPPGYLVWNDHCQIPDVNPLTPGIVALFHPKNNTLCSNEMPLTDAVFDLNTRSYTLHINDLAKRRLVGNNDNVSCCYQSILRAQNESIDNDYTLEDCVPFYQDYVLPPDIDNIIIICMSVKMKIEVQRDAHCLVREKSEVRERLQSFKTRSNRIRPVSVLMLGIDNVSRFNLRRAMPITTHRLLNDNWFELSGYNKIDDSPFPNLMALLSGYTLVTSSARCNLDKLGGLDECNLIWNLFRKNGYVTGYAEDVTQLNTFNYMFKGFEKPPVDYYLRPFMLAIEKSLKIQRQSEVSFCIGLRNSAEYVYDYALQLATRYQNEPYFGLFWANTFSHNAFDDPSSMDARIAKYLEEMKQRGILDDSIVIFFSDHGSRFGNVKYLRQGFLHERLPFIFIWLPPWLRVKHPEFVKALKVNQHRLTNPYDIHMTLKHILELSGRTEKLPSAEDCPNCQSLFIPVSTQRSCKDIAIADYWCTCTQFENIWANEPNVVKSIRVVLMHLNSYLQSANVVPPCHPLKLMSIDDAQRKIKMEDLNASNTETYRIRFTVQAAGAKFQVTVAQSNAGKAYEIIGSISRLDSYEATSACINDKKVKKYCICDIKFPHFK